MALRFLWNTRSLLRSQIHFKEETFYEPIKMLVKRSPIHLCEEDFFTRMRRDWESPLMPSFFGRGAGAFTRLCPPSVRLNLPSETMQFSIVSIIATTLDIYSGVSVQKVITQSNQNTSTTVNSCENPSTIKKR